MKIAVVGATGMVGRIILKVLSERSLPISELILTASNRSIGQRISWGGSDQIIVGLQEALDACPEIAIFSAGGSVSKEWA
ncbi:MAG: aspartate-semialdehyde dehydrogenase, partial [Crocinitomicaceae bacterium]|nr:aspartate-semialdehyde dehydrogenase [Crocinitomicaceae bacterium]